MMDGKPLPDAATTPRARHHRTPNLEGRRFGRLVVTTYAGANGAADGSYLKPFATMTELNGVTGDGTTNDDVDSAKLEVAGRA